VRLAVKAEQLSARAGGAGRAGGGGAGGGGLGTPTRAGPGGRPRLGQVGKPTSSYMLSHFGTKSIPPHLLKIMVLQLTYRSHGLPYLLVVSPFLYFFPVYMI
jgi:hypothetical protein